jgi:hypothetical protein
MNTQLVGMVFEGDIYYGELSDAHIFRATERSIIYDKLIWIPIPADWKAYLDHLPHIDIECADGSWGQSFLWGHERALQTPHGYIIPIVELHYAVGAKAFPRMLRLWEIQPRVQGFVPTALVRSDPSATTKPSKVTFQTAEAPALTASTAPVAPVRTAPVAPLASPTQKSITKPRLVKRRRCDSVDSTDAVSEKVPIPRIYVKPTVRFRRDSVTSTGAVRDA